MIGFTHLHVHSHYSLLDGLSKVKNLVKTAKKRGFSAIALTDSGVMYGAIEFYRVCLDEGIKPIIGFEAYVAPRCMDDKDSQKDKGVFNLILLAENYDGYRNLLNLCSESHIRGFFEGKPRLDKEILKKYSKNIIALSGDIRGEIPQLLKHDKIAEAKVAALEYNEIFGQDNFYLELQDHPAIDGQINVNTKMIQLAKETGIPMVVTRDVHYLNPEDAEAQDILTCIANGWKVGQTNRADYRQIDRSLNSETDIRSRFRHVEEAIVNTGKIADRINLVIELDKWHFAPVEIPKDKTADDVLRELAFNAVEDFMQLTKVVEDRLNYELDIIKTKGYAPYFLCVSDYVHYAKIHGIVESTRGSAAGSLVSYVIGITTVDPMRFKLPFERFLNPFRPSPPDIDTDFADDRRDEMIKYVTEKYGTDKVAQIITFGTMAARASVRDVGRALGFAYSFCDQVSKLIPMGSQGFHMTIERALTEEPDLKKLYDTNADVKRLLNLAQTVEGCARHTSMHAAGVVISPTPLTDFTPVQREVGGERVVTQYEMKSVEAAGVLKNDFLGIRNLAILGNAVMIVEKTTGDKVDIYKLPLDDKKVFDMLARGETMGVFQLGGSGMTRWLKELKPTNIDDIMAMVALYRPGPMESIPEYIKRKYNPEHITFFDDRLKDILQASFGLLVYQDDVMLTAIALAGYDWMEADKFRKAMGKKIPEEMAKQKEKFYQGCTDIGKIKKNVIDEMWRAIEPFAAYGFNKCVVGDTEIVDPSTGKINTIKALFEKGCGFSILSAGATHKIEKKNVQKIYYNGKKTVWEVVTRSGRRFTATGNHPVLKFGQWVNIENLKEGDQIAVARTIRCKSSKNLPKAKLKTLGYLLSEGNLCHPHGVYYYSTVDEEIKDFVIATKVFRNTNITINSSKSAVSVYVGKKDQKKPNELFEWIKELKLHGKKATEKNIPDIIFQLPLKQIAVFIAAMWQGDGCIHNDKNGQIFYATSSSRMAHQLQHLLVRFGIISTIHNKKFKYRGGFKYGYTVNVSRYDNVGKFATAFGLHLLTNKRTELDKLIKKNKILNGELAQIAARGTTDIVPAKILDLILQEMKNKKIGIKQISRETGLAERLFFKDVRRKGYLRETVQVIGKYLRSKALLDYAHSDIYWDQVKSITKKGISDTYDLTVPDNHNFVANDVVMHNSHAASYGIVAYQTAFMKAHYPVQYMTAVLQAEAGDADKVAAIVQECKRMNIEVLPPDVNESFRNFAMVSKPGEKGRIRFGLSAIKNVGEHICEVIYTEKKKNGEYKDLEDFLSRVNDKDLNKKSVESLAQSGALDCFKYDRGVLLANIENILYFVRQTKEKNTSQQNSLFAGTDIAFGNKLTFKDAPSATLDDKLVWEKTLLGLYVSSHPFSFYEKVLHKALLPLNEIEDYGRDKMVVVGGVVESATKKITKKGSVMMFVTLQDLTGNMELLVFPKTYEVTQSTWKPGHILCVVAKTPKETGDNKLFVEKAYILDKQNVDVVAQLFAVGSVEKKKVEVPEQIITLQINKEELKQHAETLKNIFAKYPGEYVLYMQVNGKTIRTQAKVDASVELQKDLQDIFGEGRVEIH